MKILKKADKARKREIKRDNRAFIRKNRDFAGLTFRAGCGILFTQQGKRKARQEASGSQFVYKKSSQNLLTKSEKCDIILSQKGKPR